MFGLGPMEIALLGLIGGGAVLAAAFVFYAVRGRGPKE